MGDRTSVELSVPQCLAGITRKILEDNDGFNEESNNAVVVDVTPFTVFYIDEANYGDLIAEEVLIAYKIPFDKDWGQGSEYGAGSLYVRFKDGEPIKKEVYDEGINPPLNDLLDIVRKNDPATEEEACRFTLYQELEEYILNHEEAVTPLDWSTQMDHVKELATQFLIAPP